MKAQQGLRAEQNEKAKVIKVLNSPNTIIFVLILLVIGLMVYSRFLVNCSHLYSFSGMEGDFWFTNGTIYVGRDLNYFGDSKVRYTGEDVVLYNFEIGYYIKDEDNYREVSIMTGYDVKDDDGKRLGASLVEILSTTNFSFTETHGKEALYLSEENIEKLDNLVFRVKGYDEKDNPVDIVIPLEIAKITR